MSIGRCPDCGKVISLRFPLHDCTPPPCESCPEARDNGFPMCPACGRETTAVPTEGCGHPEGEGVRGRCPWGGDCVGCCESCAPICAGKFAGGREPEECWAVCSYYEPFGMGGKMHRQKRYKVLGWKRSIEALGRTWELFCYRRPEGFWAIHEVTTGAYVGEAGPEETPAEVVKRVRSLLDDTPDFPDQVASMGKALDWPEVDTAEAHRRLSRGGAR